MSVAAAKLNAWWHAAGKGDVTHLLGYIQFSVQPACFQLDHCSYRLGIKGNKQARSTMYTNG